MTISSTDLKMFGSLYPLDQTYGGGRMADYVVADGTENTVFPDIDALARASGRVQMRKVFAAVTSADDDTLSGAGVSVKTGPADSAVRLLAFVFGNADTTRDAAEAAMNCPLGALDPNFPWLPGSAFGYAVFATGASTLNTGSNTIPPGTMITLHDPTVVADKRQTLQQVNYVVSNSGSAPSIIATLARPLPGNAVTGAQPATQNPAAPAVASVVLSTATSGTDTITVASLLMRVIPDGAGYPASVNGFTPSGLTKTNGEVPIFREGGMVVIRNGSTTEVAQVLSINYYTKVITFTAALAHSYASGSKVGTLLNLGDMNASIGASFSQQTWTKVFRDSLIGASISANFDRSAGPITTTNLGGETERWAIVFTSTTAFKLIGESVGQVATGTTASDFSPVNPITNTPYFTLDKDGWGSGWSVGNVLRFNTIGARAPFWLVRVVSPSAPGSSDSGTYELRGTIDV